MVEREPGTREHLPAASGHVKPIDAPLALGGLDALAVDVRTYLIQWCRRAPRQLGRSPLLEAGGEDRHVALVSDDLLSRSKVSRGVQPVCVHHATEDHPRQ